MKAEQVVAMAKAVSDDEARKASKTLTPGVHQVEFLAWVKGTLKKGEDYEQKVPAKANPWLLLALAMSKLNGVTVESLVEEAVSNSLDSDEVKKTAEKAIEKIKGTTVTKCTGKVGTNLQVVEMVEVVEASCSEIEKLLKKVS